MNSVREDVVKRLCKTLLKREFWFGMYFSSQTHKYISKEPFEWCEDGCCHLSGGECDENLFIRLRSSEVRKAYHILKDSGYYVWRYKTSGNVFFVTETTQTWRKEFSRLVTDADIDNIDID